MEKEMTIVIIDDEKNLLDVLKSYLEREGFSVFCAENGEEGIGLFYTHSPDLMIIDIMLPDIDGGKICRRVRETSNIPVIMLTSKSGEENIVRGIENGADDYITKPFSPKEVVARVKGALRRYTNTFGKKISYNGGKLMIDPQKKCVEVNGSDAGLTQAEYKIVSALAAMPNKVFSRDELLNITSGNDFGAFDRVIDAHIKNIRAKIEEDSKKPLYIQTVFGAGYRFGGRKDG